MHADWIYGFSVRRETLDDPDRDEFHAYCSAAPEAIAAGDTREDAVREMGEALVAFVRGAMKLGLPLAAPAAPQADERDSFAVPLALAIKATVYVAWRASGLSKVALGALLDLNEKEVRRILDPDHATGTDRMAAAAGALGVDLVVGRRLAA